MQLTDGQKHDMLSSVATFLDWAANGPLGEWLEEEFHYYSDLDGEFNQFLVQISKHLRAVSIEEVESA